MAPCARCNLADATIFMADVIFSVLLTDAILPLTSFSDAMTYDFLSAEATAAATSSILAVTSSLMMPFFSVASVSLPSTSFLYYIFFYL